MLFPRSESLGHVRNNADALFHLHFYGEDEGAAVITGPIPENTGRLEFAEVYRESALDAADARAKLALTLPRIGGLSNAQLGSPLQRRRKPLTGYM